MPHIVLIIDDDIAESQRLQGLLQSFGMQSLTAATGDDALLLLQDPATPALDAILLDLVLPGLDGFGLLASRPHGASSHPSSSMPVTAIWTRLVQQSVQEPAISSCVRPVLSG